MLMRSLLPLAAVVASVPIGSGPIGTGDDLDGAWIYVDGAGQEVRLDEMPTRLVMHASAAAALIPLGIRPVAIYADQTVESDPQLRGIDLDGIEIVGEVWGEINLEKVAALDPDLIVAEWWSVEGGYSGIEPGTAGTSSSMTEIAPVAGVVQGPSVVEMIADYEALAALLGADVDSPEVAGERDRFHTAVDRFKASLAAKPDLAVLAVSTTPESLWVAVPEHAAELADFVSWGLGIIVPDADPGFPYWQELSWERADLYPADLILMDDRLGSEHLEIAEAQATWNALPAVAAGQVADWPAFWLRNYTAFADELEALADAVDSADETVVTE